MYLLVVMDWKAQIRGSLIFMLEQLTSAKPLLDIQNYC